MTQSHGDALRLSGTGVVRSTTPDRSAESVSHTNDDAAFVEIYRELFPSVYGFVHFRVNDPHTAEDLTAQSFERALSHFSDLRDPERARAWVFSIARHAIADHQRSQRAVQDVPVSEQVVEPATQSAEHDAVRREEWQRLDRYLADLGDRDREVIGLRYAAGLSHREIGNLLSISEANVAQIVHRAVLKLRARFTQDEVSHS
jgi:RNA polymerase sigma-70 factor, ECF subfamily